MNEGNNKELFREATNENNFEASNCLDQRFREFYLRVRLIHYADKLARLYVKSYGEKKRKHYAELTLDTSVQNGSEGETSIKDLYPHPQPPLVEETARSIEDILPTKKMIQIYQSFSKQKQIILHLWVYVQLSIREIAEVLSCSPQNVSKLKAKALSQLREGRDRR
ncbi:sigma factor-like helix-turn-helix DNA-binding protein [Salimicrobium jeotgali]|uniref:sigma factor-like helix-turn-helix DNA-binding protein n=1 Tax=Salimicrobium jeotgali TaxID=1230341 RepID=UPI00030667B5|nr:sigma factor-like helix-turn-helix DNA-binding protein [Salimicrobium jeotgali]